MACSVGLGTDKYEVILAMVQCSLRLGLIVMISSPDLEDPIAKACKAEYQLQFIIMMDPTTQPSFEVIATIRADMRCISYACACMKVDSSA